MLPTTSDLQVSESFRIYVTCGIGFDNMTNTYKIVRISSHEYVHRPTSVMVAEILVLGTSSWRELPFVPPCDPFYKVDKVAASTHGEVHWLVANDDHMSFVRIPSLDFKKEEFHWTPHPLEKKRNLMQRGRNPFVHLLNYRGSVALVDASSTNIQIWVLVLKNYKHKKKQEWVLNYEIDIQQYYHPLERHMRVALALVSEFGEWEHGIFFHKDAPEGKFMFFMDLTPISIKPVLLNEKRTVYCCTDSMISLKKYGDLIEAEEQRYSKVNLHN